MTRADWTKLGLALVGVATWAYGNRIDAPRVQWLGVGFVLIAAALRFARRRDPEA